MWLAFVFAVVLVCSIEIIKINSQIPSVTPTNDTKTQDITLQPFLVIQQRGTWIHRPNSESLYQFNRGEHSWSIAREDCLAQGGDLEAPGVRVHFLIIGLSRANQRDGKWRWVRDNSELAEKVLPWKPRKTHLQQCAFLRVKDGFLDDMHCDIRQIDLLQTRFACEISVQDLQNRLLLPQVKHQLRRIMNVGRSVQLCSDDWFYGWNKCLKIIHKPLNWYEAQSQCASMYGANLASVHSDVEHWLLHTALNKQTPSITGAWIGGNDIETEGIWKWNDDTKWDYSALWRKGKPDNADNTRNCNSIQSTDAMVVDELCNTMLPYICSKSVQLYTN